MNRATHDEMLDLVAVHALGALPAGEAAYASAHIALCDECRAEYEKLRPAADAIALEPDNILHARDCARMKNRLMTAVRQTPSANRISRQMPTVGALIALAAAIVFGFFTIADQRKMHDLELAGAKTYAVADGEILKTPQRVVLVMRRLPPLAPGRTYQAWTLAPGANAPVRGPGRRRCGQRRAGRREPVADDQAALRSAADLSALSGAQFRLSLTTSPTV
jgi:hypothetical protein